MIEMMQTVSRAMRTAWGALMLLALLALPAVALEVRATVETVQAGGEVRIELPSGANAAVGDEVRIEAEIPGVGPVAIQTRWRVTETGAGFVVARPNGTPSGKPQKGYAAVIVTSAPQGQASAPVAPESAGQAGDGVPVQDCDRLAASPMDPQAVTAGVPAKQVQTGSAIQACRLAVQQFPESGRLAFQLARAYGLAKDDEAAFTWYRKAASLGSLAAMNNLAGYYGRGVGTVRDVDEALKLYRKAADLGLTVAMVNLAAFYEQGSFVKKDLVEARRWLKKAADAGEGAAMLRLGRMARYGVGMPEDMKQALYWYRLAAKAGNAQAMHVLGTLYNVGLGVPEDPRKSIAWQLKAAEAGNIDAMMTVAQAYDRGDGVPQDRRNATKWYLSAANAGSSAAMHNMGVRLRDGIGVERNPRDAVPWFRKAAENGIVASHYELALAYDHGRGMSRDPEEAAREMLKALKGGHIFAEQQMLTNSNIWSDAFRRALQRLMKEDGVYSGTIDGKFGAGTRRAIKALAR